MEVPAPQASHGACGYVPAAHEVHVAQTAAADPSCATEEFNAALKRCHVGRLDRVASSL